LDPNLEAIALLEPDLVIRFAGESDPDTPRRLTDLGIPHFAVRLDRVADVETLFSDLGRITGREEESGAFVQEIRDTLDSIRNAVRGRDPVRVAYLLGGNPPWVAGSGTYISELLVAAGGENVFSDLGDLYGPVSPETFLVRDIDLILAPEGAEVVIPGDGIPIERVPAGLELPGPDLVHSARAVAALLHPGAFR
jgi:iron complex transport system substrate-binding protein